MSTLTGSFGIDKLTIHVPDFDVERLDPENGWTVQSSSTPSCPEPPPLLRDRAGRTVYGTKAHFNTSRIRFDLNDTGLRIDLNPSKLKHPWQLLGVEGLGLVEDVIQGEAHLAGIHYDPKALQLSRVDLARQSIMPEPIPVYSHAFGMMDAKRMPGAAYPSGQHFKNGQRQAVFYDKRAELVHRLKKGMGCKENTLRAEARWMHHRPVTKALGLTYFHELQETDNGHLQTVYRDFMQRDVFRTIGDGSQAVLPLDLDKTFDEMLNGQNYGAVSRFERRVGLDFLLFSFGGLKGYRAYLLNKGLGRSRVKKHFDGLTDLVLTNNLQLTTDKPKTAVDLVNELKAAFLEAQ